MLLLRFNSPHVPTRIRIVLAAKRGRTAVQSAIARREREEQNRMRIQTNQISTH